MLVCATGGWGRFIVVGLILEAPSPRPFSHKVLLTIDLTSNCCVFILSNFDKGEVVNEAIGDSQIGVIIAYHSPIFSPLKRLRMTNPKESILLRCAANGLSIYSPHTALDSCVIGINDWLCHGVGDGQNKCIIPYENPPEGQEGSGSGRLVTLNDRISLHDLVERIKKFLNISHGL